VELSSKKDLLEVLQGCSCEFVGNGPDGLPCGYFEEGWEAYLAGLVKADIEREEASEEKGRGQS
jgi:hypothetical protein